jgi:hypothetical protein
VTGCPAGECVLLAQTHTWPKLPLEKATTPRALASLESRRTRLRAPRNLNVPVCHGICTARRGAARRAGGWDQLGDQSVQHCEARASWILDRFVLSSTWDDSVSSWARDVCAPCVASARICTVEGCSAFTHVRGVQWRQHSHGVWPRESEHMQHKKLTFCKHSALTSTRAPHMLLRARDSSRGVR